MGQHGQMDQMQDRKEGSVKAVIASFLGVLALGILIFVLTELRVG